MARRLGDAGKKLGVAEMKIGSLGEKSGWHGLAIGMIDVGVVLAFPFGPEDLASPHFADEALGIAMIAVGTGLYAATGPKTTKGSTSGGDSVVEFAAADSSMGFGFGYLASDLEEMTEDAIPYLR